MTEPISGKRSYSDDDDSPHPVRGDVIAGKYRVEDVVGTGGMGVVVAAQHLQLGQTVAIKLLSLGGMEGPQRNDACTRFLREGQAAARLTSDHVVRIYDVGTLDSGAPFMVMELLRGEDLAALLGRQGPAPIEVAADYIVQACDAVGEAHASGIVHRDLKPSNLFISRRNDGRAVVKVLDFGISKVLTPGGEALEGNLTRTRSVVGSPFYMSPEQVRDAKRVDARTDIWSMGMILYEILVGEPAFNAETLPGICAAIAADQPTPARVRRSDVPPELDAIVMRCLEKDAGKRFQTIGELVVALTPFVPAAAGASSVEYASRRDEPQSDAARAQRPARDLPTLQLDGPESGPRVSAPRSAASIARLEAPFGATDPAPPPAHLTPAPTTGRAASSARKLGGSGTLVSPSGTTLATSGAPRDVVSTTRTRRWLLAAAAFAVTLAGGTYFGVAMRPAAPSVEPVGPAALTLTLESVPSGARVLEGDRVLGATPLTLGLDNAALVQAPRHFTLGLDGYDPYPVTQGPSEGSVRILATLVRTAPAAAAGTVAPPASVPGSTPGAATPKAPARSDARAKAPAPHPPTRSTTSASPAPPADIRLER